MPIVCFEGPSAVGKTTLATALAEHAAAYVVPEVNLLYQRPADASPTWYLERQLDRWTQAYTQRAVTSLVILDGDPFQPFWYNWVYHFAGGSSLDTLVAFYRPHLCAGTLGFPDRYVLLTADELTLRQRKAADTYRQRRNFERHLHLIKPQQRYFAALGDLCHDLVEIVEATTLAQSIDQILTTATTIGSSRSRETDIQLFDALVHWLRNTNLNP
jgi:hypothetical protein